MIKSIFLHQLLFGTVGVTADKKPLVLFTFLLIGGVSPLYAETNDALGLLEKMTIAEQTLNYEGTVVYKHGRRTETMQIVLRFDQFGERERLSSMAGAPREMVRDDKHVFFILPANRFVLVESRNIQEGADISFPFAAGDTAFYEISLGGVERIAGYSCQVLGIMPKDQYRYGYRLCIEEQTGLLLKSQTLDGDGLPREQMIYTHLNLPESIPTESLQTTLHEQNFTLFQSKATLKGSPEVPLPMDLDSAWKLGKKPPGFTVTRNEMRQIASTEQPVRYMILEDGLASISVFIERLGTAAPSRPNGVTRSGALSTFSKVQDNYLLTVIGEVPGPTVEMIAQSLHYQPAENR